MTALHLYNTASRTIEEVKPLAGKKIKLYTCGPTVYNFAHIGNFRTFVFEDVLRRALRFFGYEVEQVMNLTDVDDKTIRGALAEKIALNDFTAKYKKAFFDDIQTLGIEKIEHYPSATDYIPQMIAMCQKLLDQNVAYKGSDGSLYFAVSKFKDYGKLSHLNLDDLKKGARVSQDEYTKEQPGDFVLWKAHDPKRDGDIFWESPFGQGRPGWHLECSVMANAILGETIDIHAGGVDLIFPHHENEIAQSECCTGKRFSRLWVHAEHLLVNGQKMSKSLGNFYTLRDLTEKGYSGKAIRFLLLQSHYRMPLNFTLHGLESAKASLQRINDFIIRLERYEIDVVHNRPDVDAFLTEAKATFLKALAHDLNIPEAQAVLYEMIRLVNGFCDHKQITTQDAKRIMQLLKEFDSVFGICTFTQEAIPAEILALVEERQNARKSRDFKRADTIRDTLLEKGYVLEDSPTGPRVKKK